MRAARKILLLTLTALAAMAFAASNASAAVEFDQEDGTNCNPCLVHIDGEASLFAPDMTTEISRCRDEFDATLYHNGIGEVEWQEYRDPFTGPGCNVTNCTAPNRHWVLSNAVETGPNTYRVNVQFCLNGLQCLGTPTISEQSTHVYRIALDTECFGGARRVAGSWTTEGNIIEIRH